MLLETHPRLRGVAAFIPAAFVVAAVTVAAATESWGDWTVSIVIGLGWFAFWAPIQVLKPSAAVRFGLALAGFALFVAGVVVWIVYVTS